MKISVSVFTLFMTVFLSGKELTVEEFLRAASEDYRLKNQREITSNFDGTSGNTPYIDEVEFRFEYDELDISEQKFSLRFRPRGWGETEYDDLTAKAERKMYESRESILKLDILLERYKLVLDYIESSKTLSLKKDLFVVLKDRINVLRKKSSLDVEFEMATVVTAENALIDLRLDIVKLENKISSIKYRINKAAGDNFSIEFEKRELVPVADLKMNMNMAQEREIVNIFSTFSESKVTLAKEKYNLEVAKTRDYLSFVNMEYDSGKESGDFGKAFSIGVGIKLPFISSNSDDVVKRKVNIIKEKLESAKWRRDISEQVKTETIAVNRLIHQYEILEERKENSSAEISFKKYILMKGSDPLLLLKLRESILKSDIRQTKILFNIYFHYINLMSFYGGLLENPEKILVLSKGGDKNE